MGIFDEANDKVLSYFDDYDEKTEYVQYHHDIWDPIVESHCGECVDYNLRIFENDNYKPSVKDENHPNCHCFYENVETKPVGSISKMGKFAPDVFLKEFGILPSYYITKLEALKNYGWDSRRNTLAGKAPGKMIGGDIFYNNNLILPVRSGRIWYECDVDYVSGSRSPKRLYYSNDGLMFYSEIHNERFVTQIN